MVIISVVVASVSDANTLCRRDGGYYTSKVIGIVRIVNVGLLDELASEGIHPIALAD